jgi:uncharacterized protein
VSVFVDTSAFMAVLDGDDARHEAAHAIWDELLDSGELLVCTSYVIVETFSLAQRRIGLAAAREFRDAICPALDEVEWVDETTHERGVAAVFGAGRRQLSLVDCVSFEVMRRRGLRRVFCFDPHFEEAGFEAVVPSPRS